MREKGRYFSIFARREILTKGKGERKNSSFRPNTFDFLVFRDKEERKMLLINDLIILYLLQ